MARQVFHPYTVWEDWQAGMWQQPTDVTAEMKAAAGILTDCARFRQAARAMLDEWGRAAEHNLTDMQQNRRAWVGQATCCHHAGIPETATRLAWWTLNFAQQAAANTVADEVIEEWRAVRDETESPGLFPLAPGGRVQPYLPEGSERVA